MNDSSGGGGAGSGGNSGENNSGGGGGSCNPNAQANLVHPQLHSSKVTTVQPQPQNYSKSGNFTYATARSIGESATCSLLASASGTGGVCGGGTTTAATSGSTSGANISTTGNAACLPRKVFIQRDYSEGTAVRFQSKFPPELEGYIEWQHFDYLISTLNCYYDKAEAANSSTFCEGCCACCTAYLVYICLETHYEKFMRKTKAFIDEQNEKIWKPRGLHVTDPLERGLRVIEITIGSKAQQKDFLLADQPSQRRN